MTNREEFILESKPTMVTVETPEVPQQCGIETGVEWSKLSKTQKKKSKAKAKINYVNQMLKDSDQTKLLDISLQQNDKIDMTLDLVPCCTGIRSRAVTFQLHSVYFKDSFILKIILF